MTKRILIVDDVEFILDFEAKAIESVKSDAGVSIVVDKASTVTDAKELVAANRYDLIISDMNLPDGTGTEIAKFALEKDEGTRIAALTIYPQRYESERGYFDAFFKKPILPSVFKENIQLLLKA